MTSGAVLGKDLGALLRVGSSPEPPFSTSKVIGVHLNYRSRAEGRGRVPRHASYFLKPPSTLSLGGGAVVRPPGCELLAFEGEVALVLGRRALRVEPAEAFSYVAAVTAANDFGVYDFRWPDSGSHVRAKGVDGFTPIGPGFLEAAGLDWRSVRLRTWVNGELRQDADMKELLFGFDELIADLSRLMTLEPGDVISRGRRPVRRSSSRAISSRSRCRRAARPRDGSRAGSGRATTWSSPSGRCRRSTRRCVLPRTARRASGG